MREADRIARRALYTRVPRPGSLRVNDPDGFLQSFPEAFEGDPTQPGFWFVGSDQYNGGGAGRGNNILPAMTRCLAVITGAVIRTPWIYADSRGQYQRRPSWVHDPMLLSGSPGPNGSISASGARLDLDSFWSTLLMDAILWGHGAFAFIEASDGTPLAGSLIPLNPHAVKIDAHGNVVLNAWASDERDRLVTDFDGRFTLNNQRWRVAVLHGLSPNHHGVDDQGFTIPEGVLLRHFDVFRLGARISHYADGIFTSGVPSGYLTVSKPNTDEQEVERLKHKWMAAHGRGKRSVAVLSSMVSYTPLQVSPVDADYGKVAQINRVDVAHAFGLSAAWLDEGMSGLSYSNSSERRADLVSLTAGSWGEQITALVESLCPFGWRVSVNWASFTAPQTETLMPALVAGVQAGIITAKEARQMLGIVMRTGPDAAWEDVSPAVIGGLNAQNA